MANNKKNVDLNAKNSQLTMHIFETCLLALTLCSSVEEQVNLATNKQNKTQNTCFLPGTREKSCVRTSGLDGFIALGSNCLPSGDLTNPREILTQFLE